MYPVFKMTSWRQRERGLLVVSIDFLAVGIDFRWREMTLLAAALGPQAYLVAALREREREREIERDRDRDRDR